ncbi:MAG: hypothetical protein AB7H80_17090, partial [Candidatus Kapaibacterium sp.]
GVWFTPFYFGFWVWGFGDWGLGFGVWGLGIGDWGLGKMCWLEPDVKHHPSQKHLNPKSEIRNPK